MLVNIQHYFTGHLCIWTTYSIGDYQKDVFKKVHELFIRLPIVFMVGGSGLYGKVIINGIDYLPFIYKEISRDLRIKMILQEELKKINIILFENNNYNRLFRSLEIIKYSNRSFSSFHKKTIIYYYFHLFHIGLYVPKYILYDSINKRVELMIKCGFMEEAQECYSYSYLNALKTIGYKEIIHFFDGKITFEKVIEEIKKNTKRYAKRQRTWYRKEKELQWFIACNENEIIQNVKKKIAYIIDKMS